MKYLLPSFVLYAVFQTSFALYENAGDVVELTEANFHDLVVRSKEVWIVEFFAPWCGHCKNLVPEYKKTAKALKGVIKVGAVDMTKHSSLGSPYGVRGFPTIKLFGADKNKPVDYTGAREAQSMVDAALSEAKKTVKERLGGRSSQRGNGNSHSSASDVVELTDQNFEKLVLNSKDIWLVEFFAPWCGHCKNLEPQWRTAASELKGKVRLGALDATTHTVSASRFGIQGYPTIKFFAPGSSSERDAEDYHGGRSSNDIVEYALQKFSNYGPAPPVVEGISNDALKKACGKQLCVLTFVPHLLDCQSECRKGYIRLLRRASELFKKNPWGWVWIEGGSHPALEEAVEVGGFGYPAMVAVNWRKNRLAVLRGSFSDDGIREFLRDLSYGKGHTVALRGSGLPEISEREPWNGKDAELPNEEEILNDEL